MARAIDTMVVQRPLVAFRPAGRGGKIRQILVTELVLTPWPVQNSQPVMRLHTVRIVGGARRVPSRPVRWGSQLKRTRQMQADILSSSRFQGGRETDCSAQPVLEARAHEYANWLLPVGSLQT